MAEIITGLLIVSGVMKPKFTPYCYFFVVGTVVLIVTLMNHYGGKE